MMNSGKRRTGGILVISAVVLLLSGCAGFSEQSRKVLLKHPETMEFVSCEVGEWSTKEEYAKKDACVTDYEKQGYVVWGER